MADKYTGDADVSEEVERLSKLLQKDLDIIKALRRENEVIHETNKSLRRELEKLKKQQRNVTSDRTDQGEPQQDDETGTEARYSFEEGGWHDDASEDIKQINRDTIDEQEDRVRDILDEITRGDDDG